jgi:hypothetical protein
MGADVAYSFYGMNSGKVCNLGRLRHIDGDSRHPFIFVN